MIDYDSLRDKYDSFKLPRVVIKVNGKNISDDKSGFSLNDIIIEMTCGFEASVAEFKIFNTYDVYSHAFRFEEVKKYIFLGSSVDIAVGYSTSVTPVFKGFISQVNFIYRMGEIPGVEVHCMDIKGIMMANEYAKQISADCYSDAVKQLMDQSFYQKLMGDDKVFKSLSIQDTPDKKAGGGGGGNETTDQTIEMVNESDYEFVVRAAKRFNYEFFQFYDTLMFRKAKADTQDQMKMSPETGMMAFEIGYDITGLSGKVEVRNVDPAKGKMVKAAKKLQSKMSMGSKAKPLIQKQSKIYIDPTAATQQDAEYRADYLLEQMSYRFGTLEADLIGLPEIMPGKFVSVDGLGKGASNRFYITQVKHSMEQEGFFQTHVSGKAATLE